MRTGERLTYLELTGPSELRPGRDVDDLAVVESEDAACIRATTLAIGAPYAWPTQLWDEQTWRDYLADRQMRHWVARLTEPANDADSGTVVGLASVRFTADELELDTFGLTPPWLGRGLGGAFLSEVVRRLWIEAPTARRLWLHTSDQDAPHALANYRARGFRVVAPVAMR